MQNNTSFTTVSDIVSECLVNVLKCTQFCESFDIRRIHTHSKATKPYQYMKP